MKIRRLAALLAAPTLTLALTTPASAEGICLLNLLCVPVQPPASTPAPAPPPPTETVTQPVTDTVTSVAKPVVSPAASVLEDQMLTLLNLDRAAAGLAPLQMNAWARGFARSFSEQMLGASTIWHNDAYFSQGRGATGATLLGENVAYDVSVAVAEVALMNSPTHRHNILEPAFTHVGIGVAVTGSGRVYVTQDFLRLPGGGAPARPATVAQPKLRTNNAPVAITVASQVQPAAPAPPVQPPTIELTSGSSPEEAGVGQSDQASPAAASGRRHGSSSPMTPAVRTGGILALITPLLLLSRKLLMVFGG